jgi:hypothetical protein
MCGTTGDTHLNAHGTVSIRDNLETRMFLPFVRMSSRLEVAKSDSDTALFYDLMLYGEMALKFAVSGLVAAVQDDRDRTRYGLVHRLVRASGIGDWSAVADEILFGPPAQHLQTAARLEQRELTRKCASGEWQHECVKALHACLVVLDSATEPLPGKVDGRKWFSAFARMRNKTKGHGAVASDLLARVCSDLQRAIQLFADEMPLFKRQWAYLHRNLSGKYRVTRLSDSCDQFEPLKQAGAKGTSVVNGVYVYFDGPSRVELADSTVDAADFYLANGGFTDKKYELLSYISGSTIYADSGAYMAPAGPLPKSITEGLGELDVQGKSFGNLPPQQVEYIHRVELETEIGDKLRSCDRYPIVTLHGRGGMGKTSLAVTVLHSMASEGIYPVIVWFSARDIDLLTEGAKLVKPRIFTATEIADEFIRLTDAIPYQQSGCTKTADYFAKVLANSPFGPTLFVFDNFETVRNPLELFKWLDTHLRAPNKILITARHREFKGDYPIEILGMTEKESDELIDAHATKLGIHHLITPSYRDQLYRESGGHPYVIKVLLGEVAKAGHCVDVERIIADREDILTALFERTFAALSPAAQRVFLTLCNWRSTLPQLAIEAVMLRPGIDRIDVDAAIDELLRYSFIESSKSEQDGQVFVTVPLTATIFGEKKLVVSPLKAAIQADTALLHLFGPGQKTDIRHGVGPRVLRLVKSVAGGIVAGKIDLAAYLPILEFTASKYPPAWLLISELHEELGDLSTAKQSTRRFLEQVRGSEARIGWVRLRDLSRRTDDGIGELQALVELCELGSKDFDTISEAANRANHLFKAKWLPFEIGEKDVLLRRLLDVAASRINEAAGTDCSRLAWVALHLKDEQTARVYVAHGLQQDPTNPYCHKLALQLGILSESVATDEADG